MTYWLQQIVVAILLLHLIVLLALWPARHVLLPLWPGPVDEYILPAANDQAERVLLVPGAEKSPDSGAALSRSRPISVVALERRSAPPVLGFLVGVREEPEGPLNGRVPAELTGPVVELPSQADWVLVLSGDDSQLLEFPVAELAGLYWPNQLSLSERTQILVDRVIAGMRQR